MEEDEAGRLRAFRRRFGRGWDLGGREGGRERPGAGIGGAVDEEGPGSLRSRGGVVREGEVRGALGMDGDEPVSACLVCVCVSWPSILMLARFPADITAANLGPADAEPTTRRNNHNQLVLLTALRRIIDPKRQ